MQYIKAERTLKPKASETIKTIITSDKFIARTHTHTHTHNISPFPHTAEKQKLFAWTDKRDESLSFCGLKSNACNQTTKVPTRGELDEAEAVGVGACHMHGAGVGAPTLLPCGAHNICRLKSQFH